MNRLCRCGATLAENARECICGGCRSAVGSLGARCVPQHELVCPYCGPVHRWMLPGSPRDMYCEEDLGLVGFAGAAPGANLGMRERQADAVYGKRRRKRERRRQRGYRGSAA